jgi:NADH:ubiquinone oxidoreductase subunit K
MTWHSIIMILQWLLFAVGVFALVSRSGWSVGAMLMAGSLAFQAVGGVISMVAFDAIIKNQAYWIPMLAWTVTTLVFAVGFILVCLEKRRPIQSPSTTRGTIRR